MLQEIQPLSVRSLSTRSVPVCSICIYGQSHEFFLHVYHQSNLMTVRVILGSKYIVKAFVCFIIPLKNHYRLISIINQLSPGEIVSHDLIIKVFHTLGMHIKTSLENTPPVIFK